MARFKAQRKHCSPSRVVQGSASCAIIPLRMKKTTLYHPSRFSLPLGTSKQWNLGGVDTTGCNKRIIENKCLELN